MPKWVLGKTMMSIAAAATHQAGLPYLGIKPTAFSVQMAT